MSVTRNRLHLLRKCELFDGLSNTQLLQIDKAAAERSFPSRTRIHPYEDAAEWVCLLSRGRLKVCASTPDGKQQILDFVGPGDVFGVSELPDGAAHDTYAQALVKSEVLAVPAAMLRGLMQTDTRFALQVARLVNRRRERLERRLRHFLFSSCQERLVHLLVELAREFGKVSARGHTLDIPLSHQDLASSIGTTRETVTLILGKLQLEGLVVVRRRQITVADVLSRSVGHVDAKNMTQQSPRIAPEHVGVLARERATGTSCCVGAS